MPFTFIRPRSYCWKIFETLERIDGLACKRRDAEHTFVDTPEAFLANESFSRFNAKREFTQRQRTLR